MSLDFFENAIDGGLIQDPNNLYRDLNQAFIDEQWDNTTARYTILQQKIDVNKKFINSYESIEAWLNYVVGQGTSMRNGHDFVQLTFRDLNHLTVRGRYYQFENNYWITTFDDEHDSIVKTVVVRRCNNILKIVDPENGAVFAIPCAVDYDMSSPSSQVSRYVITPNNHATVIVQGNEDTIRLFKINTRYILGGRPFKLYAYQNAIYNDYTSEASTLLYLDLYLDEIHDKDDLVSGVADNGDYNYQIKVNGQDMTLVEGATGSLVADVTLNGQEVVRDVIWYSDNKQVVTIGQDGKYSVVGSSGQTAKISAYLSGNEDVVDSITIAIADEHDIEPGIYIDPAFSKIREYQTINFNVYASYGGVEYIPDTIELSLDENNNVTSNDYLGIEKTESGYKISCFKRSQTSQTLYVSVSNQTPAFGVSDEFTVQAVSMMG